MRFALIMVLTSQGVEPTGCWAQNCWNRAKFSFKIGLFWHFEDIEPSSSGLTNFVKFWDLIFTSCRRGEVYKRGIWVCLYVCWCVDLALHENREQKLDGTLS